MNNIREDLKAYIDGELPEARAQEVEAAIASDPALQQEVHFMRMLGFEIKKVASEAPVRGADATINKLRKPAFSFSRLPLIPAVAVVLAVFGIGVVTFPIFAQAKDAAKYSMQDTASRATEAQFKTEEYSSSPRAYSKKGYAGTGPAPASAGDMDGVSGGAGGSATAAAPERESTYNEWYRGADKTKLEEKAAKSVAGATPMISKNRSINNGNPTTGDIHKIVKQPTLVRNADMSVKVESVHQAQDKMSDIAKKLGGYLDDMSLIAPENTAATASMAFRVPVQNFDAALIEIRNMGQVISESSSSDDVTGEVVDKESRIDTYANEEKNLIDELNKTKDPNQRFQIRTRLQEVRANLKSIRAQYLALRDIADYSTINLKFVERPKGADEKSSQGWSDDTWTNATNSSRNVGRFFGAIGMYLFAYAPFWLPVLIVGWLIARKRSA